MINRELYFRDPTTIELLNNGVSKVSEFGDDQRQLRTLRFELESFVCDGEYAKGLERILRAYLDGLGRSEQKAVWVSGFFGSGKSHLVKMLRYLWTDYSFPDGATARSLVRVPPEISDLLKELSTRSKPFGGLRAAAGTLGAGSMNNVRLAFVQLILRSVGLPEDLAQAKFVLWLRSSGLESRVAQALAEQGLDLTDEVVNLNYSLPLAQAILSAEPKYETIANVQQWLPTGFPEIASPTIAQALDFIRQVFSDKNGLPFTLLVVDEIQQFIGENIQRAMDVQEIAEHCCTELNQRLLLIGTGQSALNTTPSLQRLQARFAVRVQLSDTDVESVIRKTVLRKKPELDPLIKETFEASAGELARHLQNTRFAANRDDDQFLVADYPLLPTRRRFWEKVLRNTDHSGTKAQLRSQLQIVFEVTKQTAAAKVGTVVPADFIYDQISTDLLNSGELEREYDEIIRKQRNGTSEGELRSSLCALIFLIGKLPRTPGADDGVRANAETLVDLLVSDLKTDRPQLEQQVPVLLKQLVDSGNLMDVESEYRLQTREGVLWTQDFNRRRTAVLGDEQRINSKRAELLREGIKQALKPVSLYQGTSRQKRNLASELSSSRPASNNDDVTLWLRDGWSDEPASVLNDARAAGVDSALLFGFLPRLHHEELRQAIAAQVAAQETLDAHGPASTPEAIEARKAVETHLAVATHRIKDMLGRIAGSAKVYLGGGQEADGIELADRAQLAANSALDRLFPQFGDADNANWGQVVTRARGGDPGSLSQVGYAGDPTKNAVCRRVLDQIGAGKKGKDLRDYFGGAPFGWPKDSIDGALYVLLVAGNLRATLNGQAVNYTLPQNQIGVANFYVDVPPLDVQQRLNLKALFQKAGITTQNGKESDAAAQFLQKLTELAVAAGGTAPRPESPETKDIKALQTLSGNAQLLKIHEQKDALATALAAWKKNSDSITKRWPMWERLIRLRDFAKGLPGTDACITSMDGIVSGRSLLADPDPVPELSKQLVSALRTAVGKLQDDLVAAFSTGEAMLASSSAWTGISEEQRNQLHSNIQLKVPSKEAVGSDDEVTSALFSRTLSDRRNMLDAVPQRFSRALEEASRLLEPKAQKVVLAGGTIRNAEDLEQWLNDARQKIEEKLKEGTVILMSSLPTPLRRQLESAVKQARKIAAAGARKALEALAVHESEPYAYMDATQVELRRKLRAQAAQLGDKEVLGKPGSCEIKHLVEKLAYDQWHRLLFARYLVENNLLISPEHGVSVSLDDCEELAQSLGLKDSWAVAARFAAKELPEIFRADDPAGAVELPAENRKPLIQLVTGLPVEVFTVGDSLGWCYQFWQAERKDEVNAAGNRIGADELPAVTQLFTEDYMVDFLLDNALGAWHAGKWLAVNSSRAETAQSEEELRAAVGLPGCPWSYLRFIKGDDGKWAPAAGTFAGWPKTAKEVTCLDPCMGSGHFVVAIFERMVALRIAEESLDELDAVASVIRDNVFGLEIDPRCTQIAAFNLALTAWRRVGHCHYHK